MRIARWLLVGTLMTTPACGGGGGGSSPADVADDASEVETGGEGDAKGQDVAADVAEDTGPTGPPRVCRDGAAWAPGTRAFTDVTEAWGLTGVTGFRLGAADLDGDGFADLVVRTHVVNGRDDFSEGGARYTFVMMNRAGDDGARQFVDTTQASGFTARVDGGEGRTTHVVVFGDIDNDGDLDAFSGAGVETDPAKPDNGDHGEVLINQGDGTFVLGPGGDARYPVQRLNVGGASMLDYDRDGFLDLFVGFGNGADQPLPDKLYKGDGQGWFTDVSSEVGLVTKDWNLLSDINAGKAHRNTWGTTVCDVNDDGLPDLVTASYGRGFNGLWVARQTDDGVVYDDMAIPSGVGQDHRVDWTTNLNAQCYCKLNPDAEDCDQAPAPPAFFGCSAGQQLRWNHAYDRMPFRLGGNTFGTVCGDVDNDGDLDLMTHEIVHWDVGDTSDPAELLVNDGAGTFTRPGNDVTGLVRDYDRVDWNAGEMTGAFLDFDNDGRLDVLLNSSDYPGTHAFLFHQQPDGTFAEVALEDAIDHYRSHGIALADFDRDGDLDVAVGSSTSRCSQGDPECAAGKQVMIFRNDAGDARNFVQLQLVGGPGSNRSAIGARVTVTAGGVTQTQEVGAGYGHYAAQNELTLHFGLGAACDIDAVTVRWPDAAGTTETFAGVLANYRVRLTQGQASPDYLVD